MMLSAIELLFCVSLSVVAGFVLGQFVKIHVGWTRRVPYAISKKK